MRLARSLLVVGGIAAIPVGILLGRPVRITLAAPDRITNRQAVSSSAPPWDSLSLLLISRDPFRADRKPAPVAFNPNPVEPPDQPPPPPKPALILTGIVWGTEPSALIDGLPGTEGSHLMRPGDVIGTIRLRHIAEDKVVLTGFDTTWTLTLRRPW